MSLQEIGVVAFPRLFGGGSINTAEILMPQKSFERFSGTVSVILGLSRLAAPKDEEFERLSEDISISVGRVHISIGTLITISSNDFSSNPT
jgi:hypothetical protein